MPSCTAFIEKAVKHFVPVFTFTHYSPDPDDNPILSAAIQGQVQYVVSGDKGHMLDLETVKGIPIVTVREFVSMFIRLEN
jgi:predicted nucleic acid-binding protein